MKKYILTRLIQMIPILLGITVLSFILTNLSAADAVDIMESNQGIAMSAEEKNELRQELGLDRPVTEQYVTWLGNLLKGDMGESFVSGQPVLSSFLSKLPATIYLTVVSLLLTVGISIPLGILAAVRQNRFWDYLIRLFSFIGNSLPNFFAALLLIYFFSLKLKIFPVMGNTGDWKSVVLPAVTLALAMTSKYIRQVRAAVLEELDQEYVQGARARGIRKKRILLFSVLKASMLTIINLLALSIGSLMGGTAIVESIFMWDGVGKMAVDAITMRDYPVIQAYVIWMAVIYVVINLAADLVCHYLDPRIRLGQEEAQ